jgi:hypothetical protein
MSNPFDAAPDAAEQEAASSSLGADVIADVDALMQASNLDDLMTPTDVAVLRGLLAAVQADTSLHRRLDAFVDAHCQSFALYSADCEHDLSWTALHEEYAAIISEAVDKALSSSGRPAWEFFGLLQSALGSDPRAQSFVRIMLGWTEYAAFCELMRRWLSEGAWARAAVPLAACVRQPAAVCLSYRAQAAARGRNAAAERGGAGRGRGRGFGRRSRIVRVRAVDRSCSPAGATPPTPSARAATCTISPSSRSASRRT